MERTTLFCIGFCSLNKKICREYKGELSYLIISGPLACLIASKKIKYNKEVFRVKFIIDQ